MTKQNNGAAGTNADEQAVKSGEMAGVNIVGLSADGKTLAIEIGTTALHKSKNGNPVFGQAMWVPVTLNGDDPERAIVAKLNVMLVQSPDDTAKLRSQLRDKAAGKVPTSDARGGSSKVGALEGALAATQAQLAQQNELILALLAKQAQPAPQPVQPTFDPAAMAQMIAAAVAAAMPQPTKPAKRTNGAKSEPIADTAIETPAAS